MFIPYFIRAMLSKKCCQRLGVPKKDKNGGGGGLWLAIGGEVKPSAQYGLL